MSADRKAPAAGHAMYDATPGTDGIDADPFMRADWAGPWTFQGSARVYPGRVVISAGDLVGVRISMTPARARQFAMALSVCADEAERAELVDTSAAEQPKPPEVG